MKLMCMYAAYTETGKILGICQAPYPLTGFDWKGCSPFILEGEDIGILDTTHYVDVSKDPVEIADRPKMGLSVTQNPFSISNIPPGTEVIYPGGTITVDDGFIEWTSTLPGTYTFYLNNFPYQEEIVNAEITDV